MALYRHQQEILNILKRKKGSDLVEAITTIPDGYNKAIITAHLIDEFREENDKLVEGLNSIMNICEFEDHPTSRTVESIAKELTGE